MPLLNNLSQGADWVDPDDVPRPVVAYGFEAFEIGRFELDPHRHAKGQILLVQRGVLSCEVEGALWVVPPRSALWIPGEALHAIKAAGVFEGYGAFIAPQAAKDLPAACCAVSVSPLLRELLASAARLPALYEEGGAVSRMIAVLLDEVAAAPLEDLCLPMPADARLRRMAEAMIAAPADRAGLDAWARRAGLGARTLERLMARQTGMSFGRWRRQLAVVLAVERLAAGAAIQQVAADLGYESTPSFVTMFRKALGASPARYMAERYGGRC